MMYSGVIAKEDISDFSIKSDHMLEEFLDKAAKEISKTIYKSLDEPESFDLDDVEEDVYYELQKFKEVLKDKLLTTLIWKADEFSDNVRME